jgi:GWxTD domain-containing protein
LQKNISMTLRAILLSFLLLPFAHFAQGIQATATSSVFYKKNKTDTSKLEANILLSWRAQNTSVHFTKDEQGRLMSEIVCLIRLSTDSSIVKEETYVIKTPPKDNPSEAFKQLIADQYEYVVPAGKYDIEIVLFEQAYKNELYLFSDTIRIKSTSKSEPFLSNIQLLDTFLKSDQNTVYSRDGYLNLTLSSAFLGDKKNQIIYYYELYQANKNLAVNNPLKVTKYISWKQLGSAIPGFETKDSIRNIAAHQGFHGSFPIENLKSGNYYLNIVLSDKYDMVLDKKSIFFQRYNTRPDSLIHLAHKADIAESDTGKSAHILDLTNTFVGKYNANQVRAILKMLLLICDQNEGASINAFLKKPDELYSKYFIYNFWEKRDKMQPEKAWKAYTEKIKEVNRLFKGAGQSGYETDRGRIYIQYGKPNDRIIVNNETGALPYEIWQYYTTEREGKEAVFLFYKPGKSLGDYQLLHCSVVGERRNMSWRSLLYNNSITGSGNLVTDSQAEQYIRNK